MSFSLNGLLESIISAIISGGGTALSTMLAIFRDMKKRVEELDKKIGSVDSKSGLTFSIHLLEESIKQVKDSIENSNERKSKTGLESYLNDQSIQKIPSFDPRLREVEERLDIVENKFKRFVTEEDFELSDQKRAEEIMTIKTTLAEVRGLLRGLQSALGLIKSNR
jgi:tetrahydromethanopterin S-methyltransferase subunit G